MKKIVVSLWLTVSALTVCAEPVTSDKLENTEEEHTQASLLKSLLAYRAPGQAQETVSSVDAKKRLNGGGTREVNLEPLPFQFLAPNDTALTSHAQPVIYWYVSSDETQNVTLTLLQDGNDQTLIEKNIAVEKKGLQQIDLAGLGLSLQPDVEYRISLDGADNFSSVTLRYQPESSLKSLTDKAKAGYWYDVLQQLVVDHSPETNALLKQIGINISVL